MCKVIILASKGHPMETLEEVELSSKPVKGEPFPLMTPGQLAPSDIKVELITAIKQAGKDVLCVRRVYSQTPLDMWGNKMKSLERIAKSGLRCPITFI